MTRVEGAGRCNKLLPVMLFHIPLLFISQLVLSLLGVFLCSTRMLFWKRDYFKIRDGEEIEKGIVVEDSPRKSTRNNFWLTFPWALSAMLLSLLVWTTFVRDWMAGDIQKAAWGTYEKGFTTELDAAKSIIKLKQTKFYGAFRHHPNGTYYLTTGSDGKRYTGPPSPEVDDAWDELLHFRFSGLSKDEASTLGVPLTKEDYKVGRLYSEPSATHNLHCINYLRRALDNQYYTDVVVNRDPEVLWETSHRMHLDHCIDILRQTVQCNLDLTPVPRTFVHDPTGGFHHADPDQVHTCRDWSALRDWIDTRNDLWPEPQPSFD